MEAAEQAAEFGGAQALGRGELPPVEGQQQLGGPGVALLDGEQDAGHLTHRRHRTARR
jgi:hypothetical protein